jgi:hypothetical protein
MRKLLIILGLCFALSGVSFGVVFTTNASGEWQSATTWNTTPASGCHVTYPCGSDTTAPNGDTVVFTTGITVYCQSGHVCSWGTSPSNNTTSAITTNAGFVGLTVCGTAVQGSCTGGSGATIVYMQRSSFTNGTFTAYPGYKIFYDCTWAGASCVTATASYSFEFTGSAQVNIQGGHVPDGTTPTATVDWEGDASLDTSGLKNGATTCTADACLAGGIGAPTGGIAANQSIGTFSGNVIADVSGTSVVSHNNTALTFALNSTGTITAVNNEIRHSGYVFIYTGASTNGTLTFQGNWIHDCKWSTNTSQGCVVTVGNSSAAGTQTFTNNLISGMTNADSGTPTATNWKYNGNMITAAADGATPNNNAGTRSTGSGLWGGNLFYQNQWSTGTTEASNPKMVTVVQNGVSNIYWTEQTIPYAVHLHPWNFTGALIAGGSMVMTNNYFGGMGFSNMNGTQVGIALGGSPNASGTLTMTGNVTGPGYNGLASGAKNALLITANMTPNSFTISDTNAIAWSFIAALNQASQNPWGAGAGEATATIPIPLVTKFSSNLFTYNYGVGQGAIPKICDGVWAGGANAWSNADYNAEINLSVGNLGVAQICSSSTGWVSGDQGTHDVQVANRFALLGNMWPTLPLFDVMYGFPSGMLNSGTPTTAASYYSGGGAGAWKGAWTDTTSYTAGDVVSDAQTNTTAITGITGCNITAGVGTLTVTNSLPSGASVRITGTACSPMNNLSWIVISSTGTAFTFGVSPIGNQTAGAGGTVTPETTFGGQTTYWRCVKSHTSSGKNRPVTGMDEVSNPFEGHTEMWEEAWLPAFRKVLLASKTYTDGAIGVSGADAPHVLVAWLTWIPTMEPLLWNGCSNDAGTTKIDCGLVGNNLTHINPPMMSF